MDRRVTLGHHADRELSAFDHLGLGNMSVDAGVHLDQKLLRRSAEGDRQAFLDFAARHQAAVLRFCRALTASVEDAEDILQDTLLTAWRKAGTFAGRGSARSWLFTVARRKLYRTKKASMSLTGMDPATLEQLGLAAGWGRSSDSAGFSLDEQLEVRRGFEGLSSSDRQVLVLRELEGRLERAILECD
jgi:RNA polymerase sigma-70 factor (ECF subfamily)